MRRVLIATTVLLLLVLSSWSATVDSLELNDSKETSGRAANVVISELFISPNNLVANETNSTFMAQLTGMATVIMANLVTNLLKYGIRRCAQNVSSWLSTTSGSPPCQLPYNTVLEADERLVVFRADSDLDLSYFDGETVSLSILVTTFNSCHSQRLTLVTDYLTFQMMEL